MGPTKSHWKWTATALLVCASAQLFIGLAQAAEVVPAEWNRIPATDGAFLEGFESAVPSWATGKGELETTTSTPFADSRANVWFQTQTKVLSLSADPAASCAVAYADAPTDVNFAAQPAAIPIMAI